MDIQQFKKDFLQRFFNNQLDFRVRLFNVLAFSAAIMNILTFIATIVNKEHPIAMLICFSSSLFAFGMLIYSQKSGNYNLCYNITIIGVFFIVFPIIFFTGGGYDGGMPFYFIFAVVFTILMLEGKNAIITTILEILLYIGLCLFAYYNPHYVVRLKDEATIVFDTVIGLTIVSVVCAVVLYIHLNEYSRQRTQISLQNQKLLRYDQAKSTFLTTVAHEVKNPLAAISITSHDTLEMLNEQPQDIELLKSNLRTIGNVVLRIDRILVDLMDTVSIEQGRLSLSLSLVDIEDVLREAVATLSSDIKSKGNIIIWDIDSLPPIQGDFDRLIQVVINLLSNSVKHTEKGRITLSLKARNDSYRVSISDTGKGMSEKIRQDVFKGYVSLDKDYWRHGIGLYVSHQIITAHNGTIDIVSQIGQGTTVSFNLPNNV